MHQPFLLPGAEQTRAGVARNKPAGLAGFRRSLPRVLLLTTSLCPILISTVQQAAAQTTIGPGNRPNVLSNVVGAAGSNGTDGAGSYFGGNDGGPGGPGGSATGQSATVVDNTTIAASSGIAAAFIVHGGMGGVGGDGKIPILPYSGNGGGGAGGGASLGTNRLMLESGAAIQSSADTALFMSADGGKGGNAGEPASAGSGGQGGAGTNAASVDLQALAGSRIQASAPGAVAVRLQANGGAPGLSSNSSYASTSNSGPDGASGGAGGAVSAVLAGQIIAAGTAVLGESLGAAGGNGGASSTQFGSARGGNGGTGGNGDRVTLNLQPGSSATVSLGAGNTILGGGGIARSVGGSGGGGGSASTGFGGATAGAGGVPGSGGIATILGQTSTIVATGGTTVGLLAQSIGGAGGQGEGANSIFVASGGTGHAGGPGGTATITLQLGSTRSLISTSGADATAVAAQSIGGGGGYGGGSSVLGLGLAVSIGGSGGSGGVAGPATILTSDPVSAVLTTGLRSPAVFAQSTGGGGGSGGSVYAINVGIVSLTIGGIGGSGGTADAASVNNAETLQTYGGHSFGLAAQSVGGGGGYGGSANSLQVGAQVNVSIAVGGSGGTGGNAGPASATNLGQIVTMGSDAYGMVAQSTGGGGGSGGAVLSEVIQLFNTASIKPEIPSTVVNVAVGGTGGSAGNGNTVAADNQGAIVTEGAQSRGIFAQSIGGGGGNGGSSDAVNIALQAPTLSATTTIGGSGGAGGRGGSVTATNSGLILTFGGLASGIFAQSIGGGGGNGGYANADTGSFLSTDKTVQLTVAVGGSGGSAGDGGAVTASNTIGGISTRGDQAAGIFAQSVGGGGGTGNLASALGSGGGVLNANVAVGGGGGGGGNGGAVSAANTGAILTTGASAPGIMAQSVGGGGGMGGKAASGAGTDPEVRAADFIAQGLGIGANVVAAGNGIYTIKDNVHGDFDVLGKLTDIVTSYDGENDKLAPAVTPDKPGGSVKFSVDVGAGFGGNGGSAGSGGAVVVTNDGSIATRGTGADGIQAQSIGGGGGSGGASNPAPSNNQVGAPKNITAAIGVGGRGGSSGDGGAVTITNTGDIATAGDLASAIRTQSIGGGGGIGGLTLAQNGVLGTLTVSIGGAGGSNGNGGPVNVTLRNDHGSSTATTTGNDAPAILAQSIGGGGGLTALMGTKVMANSGGRGESNTGVLNDITIPAISIFPVHVDGAEGTAGNGGPVSIVLDKVSTTANGGFASTAGANSPAVQVQSIGGGGGVVLGVPTLDASAALKALFTANAGRGNGGSIDISVKNGFSMGASGAGSAGILAQSIGGGGGVIGGLDKVDLTAPIRATPVKESGQGGNVTVTLDSGGNVTTSGLRGHGIVALSLGGGGGLLDQLDGNGFAFAGAAPFDAKAANVDPAGLVHVTLGGNALVRATGDQSYAILAASQGNGTNAVKIDILPLGYVESWAKSVGAIFVGGAGTKADNVINNAGIIDIGTDPGIPGGPVPNATQVAIAGTAPVTVNNTGKITGSITAGNGSLFNNAAGATFNPGPVIDLGPGGQLSNQGLLATGNASSGVTTTQLTGNLSQGGTGTLVVRLDARSNQSDQLHVTGTATLAGQLTVRLLNPAALKPGRQQAGFLTADGGVDAHALSAVPTASPVLQYGPMQSGANSVAVSYAVDFSGAQALAGQGLGSANRISVGNAINAFQASRSGRGTDALIASLTELGSAQALADLYDSLSGALAADAQQIVFGAQQAYRSTLSQHLWQRSGMGDGVASAAPVRTSVWIAGLGNFDRLQGTDGQRTLNAQTAGAMMGIDHSPLPGLTVGISLGGGSSDFSLSNENSRGSTSFVDAALYGVWRRGEFYTSGSLSYGHFSNRLHRYDIASGAGLQGSGHQAFDGDVVGSRVELGWSHRLGGVAVTPYVAQDFDQLWQGSSVETGPAGDPATTSALALRYAGVSAQSAPLTLGTRLNTTFTVGGTHLVAPYMDLGWMHEFIPSRTVDVAFLAAPDTPFRIKGVSASGDAALVNVGGSLNFTERLSLLAAFNGRFSGVERNYGGVLKLQYAL